MQNFQNIGQENIVEEYFKDLNDLSIKNTHEFIEYIEEFENMNLFNEMMKNKQLKKMYHSIKNNYVCTNGLANKFDELQDLNDSQKAFIMVIIDIIKLFINFIINIYLIKWEHLNLKKLKD